MKVLVNLQPINIPTANGKISFAVESLEKVIEEDPINLSTDRLTFEELSELAEEYLEIDKEIKKTKEYRSKIWGQDKYLSKPLGNSIPERESLSTKALEKINALQSRKEYIEHVLYSNKDNILLSVSLEVLKNKIGKPQFQAHPPAHTQFIPAASNQNSNDTQTNDLLTFPEFVAIKLQAAYRSAVTHISNTLDSKEAIVNEFKKLFFKGNIPRESRLLVQLLIENKRNYCNSISSAA